MCGPLKLPWATRSSLGPGPALLFHERSHKQTFSTAHLLFVIVCLLLTLTQADGRGLALSEHISHFEPVFYDAIQLQRHHRTKRDAQQVIPLDFTAHNREFKVRLKRDRSIFSEDVVFESTNGPVQFDIDKVYAGTLEDDNLVEIQGIINSNGIFDGHIATSNEVFYMEPSDRYLKNADFHSVMYKASDVVETKQARCASQQLHQRGHVHNPWVDPRDLTGALYEPRGSPIGPSKTVSPSHHHHHPKFSTVNRAETIPSSYSGHKVVTGQGLPGDNVKSRFSSRNRRSVIDQKKTTCMLYLQADHLFFKEEGTEEACIDKITRHVQRVNNIYKVTDFDRDGRPDNVGFMIKRIKIHNENATRDPTYRFPGNYGVEKFLELFSEEDYDAFCLAYMFTYRDFEGGTLGLAWTGDLKNAGGVCEKNGHYRGSLKSLNTGIVTLLNYGKKVPPAVSHVTLAHEIGHNFGSPHDPEEDLRCTPGGEKGNYIMFARATSGDKQNNNRFSPCSLKQINSVLNSKARDTKGCFTEPQTSICGNGVVETGEECDCGWQEDCEESCCFPMVSSPKPHEPPCTLRPGKICSPSQGPCCTYECDLKQDELCREDNGCRDPQFCDGRSPYCPPSYNKPNKTICKEEFVCFKGECTGSICLAYGLESCQCERSSGDPDTKSCELCCKLPGADQSCLSSFEWNVPPFNIPDMYAKPGTPCDNYKGYCDVFQKCREVDPSGPLATLRDILLSNESLANLQRWIIEHWYAVVFVLLTLVIILLAIMRVFGKRAVAVKSTSRSKKKAKRPKVIVHKNNGTAGQFLTTVNATGSDGPTHVVHPTCVRANIPFKRRVNEVRRAATKAKRVARSQLGRPCRKSTKRPDPTATSPTDSDKSVHCLSNGKASSSSSPIKSRSKEQVSSRFSIISFKAFRPKVSSPEKSKLKPTDKKKSSTYVVRKTKTKVKASPRNRSPEKRKRDDKNVSKRHTLEDDKHRPKQTRSSSPDKGRKLRKSSTDPTQNQYDGNWLINKFLADGENLPKPVLNGSLNSSQNSNLNGSPVISHRRSDSTRALLSQPTHSSPARGIVNAAFISSPRGQRTHSSLRVTKSVSPDDNFGANKYRRSISMEAYNKQMASPDKRKRSTIEGAIEKRRRYISPEKSKIRPRPQSIAEADRRMSEARAGKDLRLPDQIKGLSSKSRNKSSTSLGVPDATRPTTTRRNSITLPSSSNPTRCSVPEQVREKLSLITASPSGSLTSVVLPEHPKLIHKNNDPKKDPKDWV